MLPRDGDHQKPARVVGFSRNNEGQKIGEFNHKPILNTKVYGVMFPDVAVHQYGANTIARGFTEIGYVPESRVIFKKNR